MAITWGPWSSNDRLRCGIEITQSPTSVATGTASVTLTCKVYLQTRYASFESGSSPTWYMSNGITASGNTDWNLGDMGTILMGTQTKVVNTSYTASVTTTITGKIHSYYAYAGTEATVTASITTAKRPYSTPSAPSGVTKARVSDTNHTVSWTRNATTGAPYDDILVDRWVAATGLWTTIATIAGTATSYSDTGTTVDNQYEWRVRAKNSVGTSAYSNLSGKIKTTPAAPTGLEATKTSGGDITTTWSFSGMAESFEVWHAADGVWDGAALATIASSSAFYTHTAPNPAVTHKYRVKSKIASPALTSAYSTESNTVQLLAPPNAPTGLSPTGVVKDATASISLQWQHNPVDTTTQTAYEWSYRIDGAAWVDSGKLTSTSQSRTVAGGTWTNGHTIEWRIRTWGQHATASAWSAIANITTSSPPTATVNTPDGSTELSTAELFVQWGYFDPEGGAQSQWLVELLDAFGSVLESKTASGTGNSTTMATSLKDATSYSVRVSVRDNNGSWSAPDTQAFSVSYARPPAPEVAAGWNEEAGMSIIYVPTRAPKPDRDNLIANPNFESNITGWTAHASGTIARVTSQFRIGIASAEFTGTTNSYTQHGSYLTPEPGEFWTYSCWVRGTGTVQMEIRARDAADVTLESVSTSVITLTSTWQRISVTVLCPDLTDDVWPLFFARSAGTVCNIDGAIFERLEFPGTYFDDTAPGRYNIVPNPSGELGVGTGGNEWAAGGGRGDMEYIPDNNAVHGAGVIRYKTNTAGNNYIISPMTAATDRVSDGTPYAGSVYVRPQNATEFHLDLQWFEGSTGLPGNSVGSNIMCPAGLWTKISVLGTAVPLANRARLLISPVTTLQVEEYYDVDAGMIEQGTEVLNFVDGDTSETEAVSITVWRSTDFGSTWQMVGGGIAPNGAAIDAIPPLNSYVMYKAEAISAIPSVSQGDPGTIYTSNKTYNRIWLNYGGAFWESVFLSPEADIKVSPYRAKELKGFAGREFEVEFMGKNRSTVIEVSGLMVRDNTENDDPYILTSSWDQIEDAVLNKPAPLCLRDTRGHRWFVSTNVPNWSGSTRQIQDVGFVARVIDFKEIQESE